MLATRNLATLLRGPCSCVSVGASNVPVLSSVSVRGAHGGAQGDGTKHKKLKKFRLNYFKIPRIPGVTYMPQQEKADSETSSPTAVDGSKTGDDLNAVITRTVPVNPNFFNRNPRNLEMMNLARRRSGWALEVDQKDYYNKIVFERTPHHTRASIVHTSGRTIVSASTEEFSIAKFLYRNTDISAAQNVGRVLGRRMLETGILAAFCGYADEERKGSRLAVFLQALTESGIQLQEGERIKTPNPFGGLDARRLK